MGQPIAEHSVEPKSPSEGDSAQIILIPQRIEADGFALRLVKEAATWVGTPFHHQGKLKQIGVDCANFINEVFTNIGVDTEDIPHNYRPEEDGSLMLKLIEERFIYVPIENRSPGDVIAFVDEALKEKDKIRHIAFISERTGATTFIIEAGRRGCVRHRLNLHWLNRVHSVWRYPR